jgi:hypothetical protein
MSLLRLMIGVFMKEQELLQLPRAWIVFDYGQEDDVQTNLLTQRTVRGITLCASRPAEAMHSLNYQSIVVAVWHEPELPEIYVGNGWWYPRVHSWSLALVHDRLDPQQVDFEHSDDEEIGDEEEIFEETERVQSEAQGDVEGDWFSFRGSFIVVGLSTT